MSIYGEDWGEPIDAPRTVTRAEQDQAKLITIRDRDGTRYYPAPQSKPVVTGPADDPYAPYAGLMNEVKQIHHSDPISRGKALFQKTLAISLFLWGLTLAALALMDGLSFFVWLLWASIEGGICFIVLATLDYRENPMFIRKVLADGYLNLMQRNQTVRHIATYGVEVVKQARELDE
jgi:hypothetical protein